ncbi:enoyl-CoA hydratase-related protein [Tropicibacter sp. Alg240-R139]|uniref:enoyl-CoA hydratase-related protein n=1 Tax=Tropicibacter sp. Alg240-R139 TaxID=2305991 RepID=UPI0013DF12AB|nr:enoyl-CoA hydratase-related protein [Tropicibacter sp. Alg240-R139]
MPPTKYKYVQVDRDGPVTVVTIDRPEALNALHLPAHLELEAVFDDFGQDPEQLVAILTGRGGRSFCAGNDLKQADKDELKSVRSGFAGLTSRFDLNKPIIAAVNGIAFGGGFETALCCDIVVAEENAVFALPEPRVGLVALAGGLHRLPRAIGPQKALEIILTSRRVTAAEGKDLGFVNRVETAEQLMNTAREIANEICISSPLAVRASKEAVMRGLQSDLKSAIAEQFEYPGVKALLASSDITEGTRAFIEKRTPIWS